MDKATQRFINNIMFTPYVECGRTIDGFDCWGLVIVCYKELLGISIPTYEDIVLPSMSNYKKTSSQISEQLSSYFPFTQVDDPNFGDFILINMNGQPLHIGFVLNKDDMLHTSSSSGVVIESYRGLKWQKRIRGYYRHKNLL